jgi:NtrC-family two-component system sensor histidine kinase KinB
MLRTKVMLGLGGLLIILLSMGLYSIDRCSELGHRIDKIGRDYDAAGRHVGELKRACGQMTGALLLRITGDGESINAFDKSWSSFEDALRAEQARMVVSPEEKKEIAKLAALAASYETKARAFLLTHGAPTEADRATARELGAETFQMVGQADSLGLAHEKAQSASSDDVGANINETIRLLMVLMIFACVVAIVASMGLTRGLLNPLASMSKSIQLVGEGDLDQTLPVLSRDELGMLATSFNRMAAQLKKYRENTSEELLRLNMTIRATLASFPDPIFVLNSEGSVEFRNPEADQLAIQLLFSGVTRLPQAIDERVEHVRLTGQDFLPTLSRARTVIFCPASSCCVMTGRRPSAWLSSSKM